MVSDLERIRTTLEEEIGQVVSLSCWAEAAGVDKKVLRQRLLFGWYCQDELIQSTQSSVLFLALNYRGMGIAVEDLLQVHKLYFDLSSLLHIIIFSTDTCAADFM